MRRLLINIVLALIVFAVMLLLAEGAWRLFVSRGDRSRTFDPELGLVNEPNAQWTIHTPEFTTTMETNSRGFRGPEMPTAPKSDELRILFLGDSFVEAKQVPLVERFVEQVGGLLSQRTRKAVLFRALAVGGAEPSREYLFYDRIGEAFDPDIVVQVFFLENDLQPLDGVYDFSGTGDILTLEGIEVRSPPPCGFKCQILKHSEVALRTYQVLRQMRSTSQKNVRALLGEGEFYWYTQEGQEAAEKERRFEILGAFADAVRIRVEARGGQYLAVLMPGGFEIHPEWQEEIIARFEDAVPRSAWNPEGLLTRAGAALEERGIAVLDLRPAFHATAEQGLLYFKLDPHLNSVGHTLAAERILEAISP
ncbi:MAG: hypothetical protein Q7R81_01585 [Candidatus Peregrinibacteria bacterium]|nr:hypothetical protein [Candidatus Peregrinibacteria bacterium]